MKTTQIGIVLLTLLLAAMVMVPMVSADKNDQARIENDAKILDFFKPIDENIQVIVAGSSIESTSADTAKFSSQVSEIVKKYDGNLEEILSILDKTTGVHLDDVNKTVLKEVIISEHFRRVSDKQLMEKRGLHEKDALIVQPEVLGIAKDKTDLDKMQIQVAMWDSFILAQSGPDVYGGFGFDNSGLPYNVNGGNNLYQVRVWPGSPVTTYQLRYYDEDHPIPQLDYQYDTLRLIIYGNLLDYALFDVTSSQIYFNSCGSNGYTYAWLTGIHANTYRPKNSVIYVANIWNHDIDIYNSNPGMGQLVMSVPYIQQ
jgi:hypothetical protein